MSTITSAVFDMRNHLRSRPAALPARSGFATGDAGGCAALPARSRYATALRAGEQGANDA